MEVLKRHRDPASESDEDLPPAKIAKQIKNLALEDSNVGDDMQGVESKTFTHLTREDYLDAINEVEIDDRFIKIPKQVSALSKSNYFERPTQALIPYKKREEPSQHNIGAVEEDEMDEQ